MQPSFTSRPLRLNPFYWAGYRCDSGGTHRAGSWDCAGGFRSHNPRDETGCDASHAES